MATHWFLAVVSVFWILSILLNRERLRGAHVALRVTFVAGLFAHVALALTLLATSASESGYALAIFSGIMGISALLLFFLRGPRTN